MELPEAPSNSTPSPIDAFIARKLNEHALTMSPQAEKRTWLRRVFFGLIGLPPSPEELKAFLEDESPDAEERIVDRLLASPRYGERWARHWMDVARYAETHGHDEDAIRENAWPYRDWLIRALNEDKPYAEFVKEQIAGDVIASDDPWATAATGFLACGPWDQSSQMGIQDGTIDKKIAQYLDRDDMLSAVMSTVTSTTVHCARCHDHKFDPVSLEDYYALQAVFAGVDKVDVPFEMDRAVAKKRARLQREKTELDSGKLSDRRLGDAELQSEISAWIAEFESKAQSWSVVVPDKVQAEGGSPHKVQPDSSILFSGNAPEKETYKIAGRVGPERVAAIRVEVLTDDSLPKNGPGRAPNGNLHLSEIAVSIDGKPTRISRAVADFNQAGWEVDKAIDGKPETAWGVHPQEGKPHRAVFGFATPLNVKKESRIEIILKQLHGGSHVIGRPRISVSGADTPEAGIALAPELESVLAIPADQRTPEQRKTLALTYLRGRNAREIAELPKRGMVYAIAQNFAAKGNFKPAGKPREIHVLRRGSIHTPIEPAKPGALSCVPKLPSRFDLPDSEDEGARRAALAEWLVHPDNVLTWRSIVNRVWHHHFGRGIVATPNDFGKMGAAPSHPELLDWLAIQFRDRGGSLKWLHKEIVLSATYRQTADDRAECLAVDSTNRLLWRANRRRLDAESIRDAVLQMSGKLDLTMGGPSARHFHSSKGVHVTPVVDYAGFNPDNPANFRRSVYRFVFRTVPDPLMQTLDCPDASQLADRRETSTTALQALAMMNNRFMVRQAEHIASRLEIAHSTLESQIERLFLLAYGRIPSPSEARAVGEHASKHGLANACRIVINSSEFLHLH